MNQIICTYKSNLNNISHDAKYNKKRKFPKGYVFSFFFISISTFLYSIYFVYDLYSHEKLSKNLIDSVGITNIYENYSNYSASRISTDKKFFIGDSSFSVIGIIDIKDIDVHYPILSDVNNDFLKIAPCRFSGPMPNEVRKPLYCSS